MVKSIHLRIYNLQTTFDKTNELEIHVYQVMLFLFTIIYAAYMRRLNCHNYRN